MKKSDYFYELPQELIAQHPLPDRSGSRLMHLCRQTGSTRNRMFVDLPDMLKKNDCIVLNDSKVIPARLFGSADTKKVEALLHEDAGDGLWEVLLKPARVAKIGTMLDFGKIKMEVVKIGQRGLRTVKLIHDADAELFEILDEIGHMPLPHYINAPQEDTSRYQTVYAKNEGSVAAPTAGLHFTPEILQQIEQKAAIARITLHVGLGTFLPVRTEDITEHKMHSEFCSISSAEAAKINHAKSSGGRIIAIGTTSCRTIESLADAHGRIAPGQKKTDIFIYPGYKFKIMDGLLTNFHLPESTLIMLVSAFAGYKNTMAAYKKAVDARYRFFSYGDAMVIMFCFNLLTS